MVIDMGIDASSGVVQAARQVPSPNYDERPPGVVADLIVVHGISMPPDEFGGPWIDLLFTNRLPPDGHPYFAQVASLRVSSHLLVRRTGELVQYVPLHKRAWHAGTSQFQGRERCNDFSIGIELEGADDVPYAEPQYETLERLARALFDRYGPLDVAGHCEIAPGRKTDPGPYFDWPRFRAAIAA